MYQMKGNTMQDKFINYLKCKFFKTKVLFFCFKCFIRLSEDILYQVVKKTFLSIFPTLERYDPTQNNA